MGFLKGAGLGLAVGGLAAAAASLIAPQPAGRMPPVAPMVDAPRTGDVPASEPETARLTRGATRTERTVAESGPAMSAPTPAETAPAPATMPADVPPVATPSVTLVAPDAFGDAPAAASPEAPILPNPQASAPRAPAPEADFEIRADATAPVRIDTPAAKTTIVAIDTPQPTSDQAEAAPTADVPDAPATQPPAATRRAQAESPDISTEETSDLSSASPEAPTAAPEGSGDASSSAAPEEAEPPSRVRIDTPVAATSDGSDDRAGPMTPVGDARSDDGAERPGDLPSDSDAGERSATPDREDAPGRVDRDGASRGGSTARIVVDTPADEVVDGAGRSDAPTMQEPPAVDVAPTIGTVTAGDPSSIRTTTATKGAAEDDRPAIEAHAAFFDAGEDRTPMSVVVIDTSLERDGAAALGDVPFAVTVALDPTVADATARMEAYREAGFEVAVLLPGSDTGSDRDGAARLDDALAVLPESVALVTLDDAAEDRAERATAQIVRTLAADGRGLLTAAENGADVLRSARAGAVPALSIFRDLRTVEQSPRTLRRFLDQSASRAEQQAGVVVIADLTPEVLSALSSWRTLSGATEVALAPLSATLLAAGR